MPARIARLPRDHRGYPVPYFVEWRDGVPLFPILSPVKWARCVGKRLCWVCGEQLGRNLVFAIGPMCTINQISSEPPAHRECIVYALQVCPFLINPRMGRVPTERFGEVQSPGGIMDPGNPGVMAMWANAQLFDHPHRDRAADQRRRSVRRRVVHARADRDGCRKEAVEQRFYSARRNC